jgi:predicted metal-binding protein
MSVDEFTETLKGYEKALILQVESDFDATNKLNMPITEEAYRKLEKETRVSEYELKLHRIVNQLETEAFKRGYYFATGLIAGSCKLCTECVGQGGVCKYPFEARPSMEAMSIDVVETCRRTGLPLELSSDRKVRWTGLVLLY